MAETTQLTLDSHQVLQKEIRSMKCKSAVKLNLAKGSLSKEETPVKHECAAAVDIAFTFNGL